jgi:16S rRNA (cytidine1402-2'-O)-methyltransferase
MASETRTMVLFEAPHRLPAALADLVAEFGAERTAVACRELTKTYEEVRRGSLRSLAEWAADGVRGEVTLVIAGAPQGQGREVTPADLAAAVVAREVAGEQRRDAIAGVARELGVPRRVVYDAVVAAKGEARTRPGS